MGRAIQNIGEEDGSLHGTNTRTMLEQETTPLSDKNTLYGLSLLST